MKSLFYILAVVAIIASGYFGWTAKENYVKQLADRDAVKLANDRLSKSIEEKNLEETDATAAKELALDDASKAKSGLEVAEANAKELASTLDQIDGDLEIAVADKKKIDEYFMDENTSRSEKGS